LNLLLINSAMRFIVICSILFFLASCWSNKIGGDSAKSSTSLSWEGVYRGVLPCADCEGITTMIHLKKDLTYVKSMQYMGKSSDLFTQNGSFQWNREGTVLTLMPWEKEEISDESKAEKKLNEAKKDMYLLGENELVKLDQKGKRVQGALAHNYVLKKYDFDNDIREKYWRLIELNGTPISVNENQKREAHFTLRTKDKRIVGHGGCNAFSGSYDLLEGSRIQFSPLASTQMACAEVSYEPDFFMAIQNADNYTVKRDTLCLNKARMAPLARLVAVYFR
jgi:copper homeostasis protein (lipoprotein)